MLRIKIEIKIFIYGYFTRKGSTIYEKESTTLPFKKDIGKERCANFFENLEQKGGTGILSIYSHIEFKIWVFSRVGSVELVDM